jgi:hypothetical protein
MEISKENLRNFINKYPVEFNPLTDDIYEEAYLEGVKDGLNELDYFFMFKSNEFTEENLKSFINTYPLIANYYSDLGAQQAYIEGLKDVLRGLDFDFIYSNLKTETFIYSYTCEF